MKAIIDEKLENVLTKIGVWEDLCSQRVHCAHCNKILDVDNIGMLIPRRDEEGNRQVEFYCNEPDCINAVLKA